MKITAENTEKGHVNFPGEMDAVRTTVEAGRQHGFGNMIDRLGVAWAIELYEKWGMELPAAFAQARLDPERATRPGGDLEAKLKWCREYIGDTPQSSDPEAAT